TKVIAAVSDKIKSYLPSDILVVNLAKGLLPEGETIVNHYKKEWEHQNFISLKGASFSAEMIHGSPTLFTVGFEWKSQLDTLLEVTEGITLFLDYTPDILGVELLSAIKNIYAIALGNVDAQYNSLNTRFLMLTKAIEEIKVIIRVL